MEEVPSVSISLKLAKITKLLVKKIYVGVAVAERS